MAASILYFHFQHDTDISALNIGRYQYQTDVSVLQMKHTFIIYFEVWRVI